MNERCLQTEEAPQIPSGINIKKSHLEISKMVKIKDETARKKRDTALHTGEEFNLPLTTSQKQWRPAESGVFSGRKNTINPKSYALQKDPSSIKVK